jgi:uncharacterized protein YndB with AHSA1/START domain
MARNEVWIDAPPDAVFAVLADPGHYAEWVVGSREIRGADERWPEPGTALAHTIGVPPLLLADDTIVERAEPPVLLVLRARARPLPSARVTIQLQPDRDGTRLTLVEDPANPLVNLLAGPLGHAALRARNHESLRRLKALAERA